MAKNNFDGMLELLSVDKFNLKNLKKQYKKAALIHHPDRGGNEENFKILNHHYQLLLPLIDNKPLSEKEVRPIKEALLKSSQKVRKELLEEMKSVNLNAFNLINISLVDDSNAEWRSFNTRVLSGEIFSKANFESLGKISYSKYSQFFTPFESKGQFFSTAANFSLSSLKLSVYILLSTSVLNYFLNSAAFFYFHSPVLINTGDLKSDPSSFSFKLAACFYSILLDSISTLINPFIDLLTLVIRSGVTIASVLSSDDVNTSNNETVMIRTL